MDQSGDGIYRPPRRFRIIGRGVGIGVLLTGALVSLGSPQPDKALRTILFGCFAAGLAFVAVRPTFSSVTIKPSELVVYNWPVRHRVKWPDVITIRRRIFRATRIKRRGRLPLRVVIFSQTFPFDDAWTSAPIAAIRDRATPNV